MTLTAPDGLKPGDMVTLHLPENRMPIVALLGYMVPTLAMLLGAGIGNSYGESNVASLVGGLGGFLVAMGFSRFVVPRIPRLLPEPEIVATGASTLHPIQTIEGRH